MLREYIEQIKGSEAAKRADLQSFGLNTASYPALSRLYDEFFTVIEQNQNIIDSLHLEISKLRSKIQEHTNCDSVDLFKKIEVLEDENKSLKSQIMLKDDELKELKIESDYLQNKIDSIPFFLKLFLK